MADLELGMKLQIDVFHVYGDYIPAEPSSFYGPGCSSEFFIDKVFVDGSQVDLSHVAALTKWLER